MKWANNIVETFPGEHTATYYVPFSSDRRGNCINAHGKLQYHYEYMLRILRKSRVIEPKNTEIPAEPEPIAQSDIDVLEQLRTTLTPWELVKVLWQQTYQIRRRILLTTNTTVEGYFNSYPCLGIQRGLQLVKNNYDNMFNDKKNLIFLLIAK